MTFDAAVVNNVGTDRVEWVEDADMEFKRYITNEIANDKYRRVRENDILKVNDGILYSPAIHDATPSAFWTTETSFLLRAL